MREEKKKKNFRQIFHFPARGPDISGRNILSPDVTSTVCLSDMTLVKHWALSKIELFPTAGALSKIELFPTAGAFSNIELFPTAASVALSCFSCARLYTAGKGGGVRGGGWEWGETAGIQCPWPSRTFHQSVRLLQTVIFCYKSQAYHYKQKQKLFTELPAKVKHCFAGANTGQINKTTTTATIPPSLISPDMHGRNVGLRDPQVFMIPTAV